MSELQKKYDKLTKCLQDYGRLAIAFSGGVDSALLLKAASFVLPPGNLLTITARADIFPSWEFEEAAELVESLNVEWLVVPVDALAAPGVADNPPDRCYFCKKALFQKMMDAASERGFTVVADGSNMDDLGDFRPGAKAVSELGVVSPLKEAGMDKTDIRALSAQFSLPTWNKPAYACLASRFPYGRRITVEELKQVEQAENVLRGLGFAEVRVRHHGDVARIEIGPDELARFLKPELMADVNKKIQALGFPFSALDLAGYRRGSLNETVEQELLKKYEQNK
ncbi:ATP-dependent sacrificial sulfur transferase LarE [Deltaproteobacteria bacterium Smac51]|nr:ATP-dependent sacrificial sulfur transferase LarE [Deltaproteobacteria bacterium Smac51]